MTDINIPTLTDDLTAAGLTPIIIDENTDMNAIADIPAEIAEADATLATQTTIDKVQLAAKLIGKSFGKFDKIEAALTELGDARLAAKQRVADAMAGDGNGFDEASRAFKQANNKFDKALDSRDAQLNDMDAGIEALLDLLYALSLEVTALRGE